MIHVLIAGPMPRIIQDIEKLEPHCEVIEVSGIAHQQSEILDETRLRRPDVLLLHDGFSELTPADVAAQIEPLSPTTRVLLVTSQDCEEGRAEPSGAVHGEAEDRHLVDAIVRAAAPSDGGSDAEPRAAGAGPAPSAAPRIPFYRRRFSLGRR